MPPASRPRVIAPPRHDTASAVEYGYAPQTAAFISCGTWSLMGVLSPGLVTSEASKAAGLSNEHAWDGQTRLLKKLGSLCSALLR